jgi:hypothetical protein
MKFNDGGLGFLQKLAEKNGNDLGYSLALESGNVYVIIVAYPSMTKKRWKTHNERSERIMFHVPEYEYDMDQDELIDQLSKKIENLMYYVDEDGDET